MNRDFYKEKKIVILANNSGGLYLFRRDLIVELIARGHEVVAYTPFDAHIDALKDLGIGLYELNMDFLKLDCSKLKTTFGWKPSWNVETTMEKIVEWSVAYLQGQDVGAVMDKQIESFLG